MGFKMNHDYAHCEDFTGKCPKECFRAKLCRDLKNSNEKIMVTYCSFINTDECPKKKNK